jgi:error-prone DNA polymerase
MGFKRSVERMSRIEERLLSGMRARGIEPAAQEEILRGITSFALYGFPESHAASFALIAYASSYLKCHHPAAFLAGLLNAQPMGFYNAATLVKDAQRHGVVVLPVDVARSRWKSALESAAAAANAVRLGLRLVSGLREETAARIAGERERAPFASTADFSARVQPRPDELASLAELGALAGIDARARTRRSALWQVSALVREPLLARADPAAGESPLREMSAIEETLADYRRSGVTIGAHLLEHLRPELSARGVLSAAQLRDVPDGRYVRTAGHAIVRQRPSTAKGFCFLTLEDETGTANAVLTPGCFARFRAALHGAELVELAGPIQNVEGVIHVRVRELIPLRAGGELPRSHDYR